MGDNFRFSLFPPPPPLHGLVSGPLWPKSWILLGTNWCTARIVQWLPLEQLIGSCRTRAAMHCVGNAILLLLPRNYRNHPPNTHSQKKKRTPQLLSRKIKSLLLWHAAKYTPVFNTHPNFRCWNVGQKGVRYTVFAPPQRRTFFGPNMTVLHEGNFSSRQASSNLIWLWYHVLETMWPYTKRPCDVTEGIKPNFVHEKEGCVLYTGKLRYMGEYGTPNTIE